VGARTRTSAPPTRAQRDTIVPCRALVDLVSHCREHRSRSRVKPGTRARREIARLLHALDACNPPPAPRGPHRTVEQLAAERHGVVLVRA